MSLLAAVYMLFVVLPWGRAMDHAAFVGRLDAGRHLLGASRLLLQLINVPVVAIALMLLIWWAWRGGRVRLGLISVAAVSASVVTAEALKMLLPAAATRGTTLSRVGHGSFPSGHATIAAAFALAVMTLASSRERSRLIGPAAGWTIAIAVATVTAGWHRPSDAVGGILLAVAWHRGLTAASDFGTDRTFRMYSRRRPGSSPGPGANRSSRAPDRRTSRGQGIGWSAWGWWAAVAVVELTLLVLPSPTESPWEPAAVRHYLAVVLVIAVGGGAMLWAGGTLPARVRRLPRAPGTMPWRLPPNRRRMPGPSAEERCIGRPGRNGGTRMHLVGTRTGRGRAE